MIDKSLDKNSTLMQVMNTKAQLSRLQHQLQEPSHFDRTENSLFSVENFN